MLSIKVALVSNNLQIGREDILFVTVFLAFLTVVLMIIEIHLLNDETEQS